MKKLFALMLVMALILGATGCKKDDRKVINFWHLHVDETSWERKTIEAYIKDFETAHPDVKIVQHPLYDDDYKNKMYTEFTGNAEGVDVFTYWGAGRAGEIVKNGKMLCIDDYLTPEQRASIKPGADYNFLYEGGKLYGIPTYSWMMVLFINTEMFDERKLAYPETFDQWMTAVKAFAAEGIEPLALGGGMDDAWQAAFIVEAMVNRFVGAKVEDAMLNGGAGREGAMFRKAGEAVVALNKAGAFGKSPLEESESMANTIFLSGVSPMRLTGSWLVGGVYSNPDSVVEGKVKAMPVPSVKGGEGLATDYKGGFIDGIYVNKATKTPELSSEFAYGIAVALATGSHSQGQGFTAFNLPVDESGLTPLGVEVAGIAKSMGVGIVAWDTFLDQAVAEIHLKICQQLLKDNDVDAFVKGYGNGVFK